MFDDIGKIDWAHLRQAHGSAEHVPDAIRDLISSNEETRKSAYWRLENYVVVQRDLYEAAFYVVPFLLEILRSDIRHGRHLVYNLLFEIANGLGDEEDSCAYNGERLPLTEACRRVVADGRSIFLSEISDQQSDCREKALDLLVSLDVAEGVLPSLRQVRDAEPKSDFVSTLEEAIAEMESQGGKD